MRASRSSVAEDLDFRTKKAWLKRYGKRFATVLSLFRSRQLLAALSRQCARRGVEVIVVDPAWTTKLAQLERLPSRYRLGVHHAAALVIGRRGLGFAQRVSKPVASLVRFASEAPRYAWRSEHGPAMAAPRVAPGQSGRCTTKTRGPCGPRRGGNVKPAPGPMGLPTPCPAGPPLPRRPATSLTVA